MCLIGECAKVYPTRRNGYESDEGTEFSCKFKVAVALESLRGDKTVQEIAASRLIFLI